MADPNRTLYRADASDRLSSPDELERLMPVTNAKDWLLIVTLARIGPVVVQLDAVAACPTTQPICQEAREFADVWQPVVKVARRTALRHAQGVPSLPRNETGEAPRGQGATTENMAYI